MADSGVGHGRPKCPEAMRRDPQSRLVPPGGSSLGDRHCRLSGVLECGFVFCDRFVLAQRLVVAEYALDTLLIPSRRQLRGVLHRQGERAPEGNGRLLAVLPLGLGPRWRGSVHEKRLQTPSQVHIPQDACRPVQPEPPGRERRPESHRRGCRGQGVRVDCASLNGEAVDGGGLQGVRHHGAAVHGNGLGGRRLHRLCREALGRGAGMADRQLQHGRGDEDGAGKTSGPGSVEDRGPSARRGCHGEKW